MEELNLKIFDLALGRTLKAIYLNLKEDDKLNMEKIFLAENDTEKQVFLKKHAPTFKKIFAKELKNLGKDIVLKIENLNF